LSSIVSTASSPEPELGDPNDLPQHTSRSATVAMIPLTVPDVVINDGAILDFGGWPSSARCSNWNSNLRPRSTAVCSLAVFSDLVVYLYDPAKRSRA